jgi:hypothetical protein
MGWPESDDNDGDDDDDDDDDDDVQGVKREQVLVFTDGGML